jgi:hypothetical protein
MFSFYFFVDLQIIPFYRRRVAHRNGVTTDEESGDHTSSDPARRPAPPLPPSCNHPQCVHAHELLLLNSALSPPSSSAYVGLGSLWFPEVLGLEASLRGRPPPAAAQLCRGPDSCDSCRQLGQPPPSYTKLFLEESPPSYKDAVTGQQLSEISADQMQAATALCSEEQIDAQSATTAMRSEEQMNTQAATAVCPEEQQVETTVTAVCPEEQGEVQTAVLHPINAGAAVFSQEEDRTVNVNVEQS